MALLPANGTVAFTVDNTLIWVGSEGIQGRCGGGFTTIPGTPSVQLLPSTNTTVGYYNGNMLAYAAGDGTGIYADLTAGALVNWDVNSDDTGQQQWNQLIICDGNLVAPLDINTTTAGTILFAVPKGKWVIRQQFLYGGGTPSTDATAVAAALQGIASFFQSGNPSSINAMETVFTY